MEIIKDELIFAKVKKNAIIPSKLDEDAGFDIYACFDEDYMVIEALTTKLIPTGIASAMSDKYYIQIEERGSTGSKGIKKSAGVIDSGYRGEWFIAITNTNDTDLLISKLTMDEIKDKYGRKDFYHEMYIEDDKSGHEIYLENTVIYPYSKAIAQAIIHEVYKMQVKETTYEELLTIESTRGIGALGSSTK